MIAASSRCSVVLLLPGLIKLFNRNEDMIATVVGHECAHAIARHSSEKLTLGLFVALAVQVREGGGWNRTASRQCTSPLFIMV